LHSPADVRNNPSLLQALKSVVGARFVLTSPGSTLRYRKGFRFGEGAALAVVRPGSLLEQWNVLRLCAAAGKIVIVQAANTGLTGGSTPAADGYDRDIVIVNTMRLSKIYLLREGRQVVCLPGATLFKLEKLLEPLGRNPHSVIGSSCIGASVLGGICNNSGGSLIRRGPAYTQMALYARLDESGNIQLVNHLGIDLGSEPEEILTKLEKGEFTEANVVLSEGRACSDSDYERHVRQIDAATPARFNADPRRLFEASGSAGKIMVFAVRLDTFPKERQITDFYVGTNDPSVLTEIRRYILEHFKALPIQGEYLHRDAFAIAEKYGKDTFLAIQYLGTDWLPTIFAVQRWFESLCLRVKFLPRHLYDHILQAVSALCPRHLPKRMYEYHRRFEHHLLLRMADEGVDEARVYLNSLFPSARGAFFECTPEEGRKAFLHRFATAGAAIRYRAVHRQAVQDILALDVALPRDCTDWLERLPHHLESKLLHKIYYGHFFCHVFHQDYLVRKGCDPMELEQEMRTILDARGAEFPAEHNVGHLYEAKPSLARHYRALDPSNSFNPGIGRTSKLRAWH
jgi:D-lactate dehydrogenase